MSHDDDTTTRALDLLRANHAFPGPFAFRVVVLPGRQGDVIAALAVLYGGEEHVRSVSLRESRTGRYLSIRIDVHVTRAEDVLSGYDVLRRVEGVVTAL